MNWLLTQIIKPTRTKRTISTRRILDAEPQPHEHPIFGPALLPPHTVWPESYPGALLGKELQPDFV